MEPLEYYAYLATTLSPRLLARAATRRIVQRATQMVRGPLPGDREILEAFCAEDASDLALKLAAPRASQLWSDASRRDDVKAAALRVPGARERALQRAEAAWRREFDVFGTHIAFGRGAGIDWHRDALHGASFDPALDVSDPRLWKPGLDPKAPWTLARMDQAIALGQGVWLARSDPDAARWAHELTVQVRHFDACNPPGLGVNWSVAMEVALRGANLALAFLMMRHRPELQEPEFALCFARLLAAHGRFVEAHLEHTSAVPNNHYVANLVGLLHLAVIFPELPRAPVWRTLAIEGLEQEMRRQVLDDGFSFEGSTSYHRLATELFTLGLLTARAARVDLGADYRDRLHAMYRAVRAYLAPSGRAPQVGDNDSGRAIVLASRSSLEHGYLLPLGAALFEDPELKPEGSIFGDEALFLLGGAGLDRWEALPESGTRSSSALPKGGIYVLRSAEAYCAISCGPNGQGGVGGHSHNDKLGIEVHHGPHALVVDPGTYCYISEPELRNAFRSTAAHSTLQVDGAEQSRILEGQLFALPDDARARALTFESTPARERFVGEHRGFERIAPGLRHRREVAFDRAVKGFLILDRLLGTGEREGIVRFQLPDRDARWREASGLERDKAARLGLAPPGQVVALGPEGAPRAVLVPPAGATVRLAPSWYSPGYGVREPSLTVEIRSFGKLPIEIGVAILLPHERTGDRT